LKESEKYKKIYRNYIGSLHNYFILSVISCIGEISEAGKFKVTASCINCKKVLSII